MAITITAGSGVAANNASINPTNPTHVSGDTLLAVAIVRSSTATLACATSGWTAADGITNPTTLNGARLYFFQNECDSGAESNPTITISGGAAGVTNQGVVLRIQGRDFAGNFVLGTVSSNAASTTTITFGQDSPSIDDGNAIIAIGHILDDYLGAPAALSGQTSGLSWSEILNYETTTGNDQTMTIDYAYNNSGSTYTAGTSGVKSGGSFTSAVNSGVYLEVVGATITATPHSYGYIF